MGVWLESPSLLGSEAFCLFDMLFCLILQPIRDGIVGAWAIFGNRPRR